LTPAELAPITAEAVRRWGAAGLAPAQVAALAGARFRIADLGPAGQLGLAPVGGSVVELDDDGAGRGWFLDPTPADDAEFGLGAAPTEVRAVGGAAAGGYDLLTVVMHELGHVLGRDDLDPGLVPHDLLTATLPTGTRRLPAPVASDTLAAPTAVPTPADTGPEPGGMNPVSAGPGVAASGPADDRSPSGREVPARAFWLGVPVGEGPFAPQWPWADAGRLRDDRPGGEPQPADSGPVALDPVGRVTGEFRRPV